VALSALAPTPSKNYPFFGIIYRMTPQLSEELRHALATQPGLPLQLEDPETHARYVLVQLEVFERLQHGGDYETHEPSPREFYPLVDRIMQEDDAHDPTLESYQQVSSERESS
jgi:hypothetical protein